MDYIWQISPPKLDKQCQDIIDYWKNIHNLKSIWTDEEFEQLVLLNKEHSFKGFIRGKIRKLNLTEEAKIKYVTEILKMHGGDINKINSTVIMINPREDEILPKQSILNQIWNKFKNYNNKHSN